MRKKQNCPQRCKESYRKYDHQAIKAAYDMVMEKKISVRKAASMHGIPESTLRMRVQGSIDVDTHRSGPPPLLSEKEEKKLVDHVKYMASIGHGYTRTQVAELATEYARYLNKLDESRKDLSLCWFYNFVRRWPELNETKPQKAPKVLKTSGMSINDKYFTELKDIVEKYKLESCPQNIMNVDERVISVGQPGSAAKSSEKAKSPKSQTVTVIGGGNAIGVSIPPYFVFSGEKLEDGQLEGATPGAAATVSENGCSSASVYKDYLQNHLTKFLQGGDKTYNLVLYDGSQSKFNISLIEWAKQKKIILFELPPHAALRPMNIRCYSSFEQVYSKLCQTFMGQRKGKVVTRKDVCKLACTAYTQVMIPGQIQTAFKAAGIYPLSVEKMTPTQVYQPKNTTSEPESSHKSDKKKPQPDRAPSPATIFLSSKVAAALTEPASSLPRGFRVIGGGSNTEATTCRKAPAIVKTKRKAMQRESQKKRACTSKSPEPGTSAYYTSESSSYESEEEGEEDEVLEVAEVEEEDVEEEEGDVCCVCEKFQPQALEDDMSLTITQWAQCSKCSHWTHLMFCSSVTSVKEGDPFYCPHCTGQITM